MRLPSTPRRGYLILWWIFFVIASVFRPLAITLGQTLSFRALPSDSVRCRASASSFQGLLTSASTAHRDTHRRARKEPLLPQAQNHAHAAAARWRGRKVRTKKTTTHKVSTRRAFPRARGRYWCGRRPGGALAEGFSRGPRRRGAAARVGGSRFTPAVPVESRRAGRACSRTSRRGSRRLPPSAQRA